MQEGRSQPRLQACKPPCRHLLPLAATPASAIPCNTICGHAVWICFFFLFFVSFLTSIAESFSSLSPTCQVLKLPPLHHMIPTPVPPQGHKSPLLPLPHYLQACGHRLFTLRHTQVHCHLHSITAHTTCHDTTPMPSQHGMQARYDANLL